MQKKPIIIFAVLWLVMVTSQIVAADNVSEKLLFEQTENGQKALYLYETDRAQSIKVVSGKKIQAFYENKHLFYFVDHKLYEYYLANHQATLVYQFAENDLAMTVAAASNGLSQLAIAARGAFETNYYILDLSDSSIRRFAQPSSSSSSSVSGLPSRDGRYLAVPKSVFMHSQVVLHVQSKIKGKFQTIWSLPSQMTILPDLLSWSPDSKWLTVAMKPSSGYEGFYSLYCFNVETKQLKVISEPDLFYSEINGSGIAEFAPDWSDDSAYVVLQRQATGSPTQSDLVRYEVKTGKIITLTTSAGQNQNPQFSPSGKNIAFLSNRNGGQKRLYLMDSQGGDLRAINAQGITNWAMWLK